mmetsp:Transcript_47323/g.75599  ORF Transcript_47323/g.75599 Transcript_47323/m.75599 type:complete len:206 (+) Transcript_47323:700-1317(+)
MAVFQHRIPVESVDGRRCKASGSWCVAIIGSGHRCVRVKLLPGMKPAVSSGALATIDSSSPDRNGPPFSEATICSSATEFNADWPMASLPPDIASRDSLVGKSSHTNSSSIGSSASAREAPKPSSCHRCASCQRLISDGRKNGHLRSCCTSTTFQLKRDSCHGSNPPVKLVVVAMAAAARSGCCDSGMPYTDSSLKIQPSATCRK